MNKFLLFLLYSISSLNLFIVGRSICCSTIPPNDANINTDSIIECIEDAILTSLPLPPGSETNSFTGFGPHFVLAIVSRATRNIWEYAAYSRLLHFDYASTHGYYLLPLQLAESSIPDYQHHRKLVPLLEAMDFSLNHSTLSPDYVIWMDSGKRLKFD